ncbi:MAG: DUF427 domain-containing protein [Dehalococcoidales bacterium]
MLGLKSLGRKKKTARATWKNAVLAESDNYQILEDNVNFPMESVNWEYLKPGSRQHTCPWKGEVAYFDIVVDGRVNKNAAWTYPDPLAPARSVKDYVAFGTLLLGGTVKVES